MLQHKLIIRSNGGKMTVSCECRAEYGKHDRRGGDYHKPMIRLEGETMFDTFNKADNHWAPFEPKDRIKT